MPDANSQVGGGGSNGSFDVLGADDKSYVKLTAGGRIIRQVPFDPAGRRIVDPGDVSSLGTVELYNQARATQPGTPLIPIGAASIQFRGDGSASIGGGGASGNLKLVSSDGKATIQFRADGSGLIGGEGVNGNLKLVSSDGKRALQLGVDPNWSTLMAGDEGYAGQIMLTDNGGAITVGIGGVNASLRLGAEGRSAGQIEIVDSTGARSVVIDGASGDITLGNADCAEEFDVDEDAIPGSVVAMNETGNLGLAREPYDSKVVGIISGLGAYRPAIVLDRHTGPRHRLPVAVLGKVMCLVDADFGPIRKGNLLTSSSRPGYAMAAFDRNKAFGSVVGKALADVEAGQTSIPVLVMNR